MSDTIEKQLISIISKNLSVDESRITSASRFGDDLGADSLDTVEILMAIEEKFGIEIPDEAAEKIRTVAEAVTYIKEHIKEKAS